MIEAMKTYSNLFKPIQTHETSKELDPGRVTGGHWRRGRSSGEHGHQKWMNLGCYNVLPYGAIHGIIHVITCVYIYNYI